MVSEVRKQSMAWMETDYYMGEMAPLLRMDRYSIVAPSNAMDIQMTGA